MRRRGLAAGWLLVGLLARGLAAGEPAVAAAEDRSAPHYLPGDALNVKAFGAVGDGVADDTDAIQKALDAVESRIKRQRVNGSGGWSGGRNENAYPEVVFPEGAYRLTRTLLGGSNLMLRGVGRVVVEQSDPAADLLYQHKIYRFRADGIVFRGGFVQLHFGVANTDASRVLVNRCVFESSRSEALRCHAYRDPKEDPKLRPDYAQNANKNLTHNTATYPYTIERQDGRPILTRVPVDGFVKYYNSTLVIVRNSAFKDCARALSMAADGLVVENCRVDVPAGAEGPVFVVENKNEFTRITASAPAGAKADRWFDSAASGLSLRDCVFESAAPMALIRHFEAKPRYHGVSLTVESCRFHAAGNALEGVVRLDSPATVVSLRGNREVSGRPVKALAWGREPAAADFLKARFFTKYGGHGREIHYAFDDNGDAIDIGVPAAAREYVDPVPPKAVFDAVRTPTAGLDANAMDAGFTRVVDALAFGVVGDGKTDDADALAAALAEAGKHSDARVVLPGRVLRIGRAVTLPARVAVVGAGSTILLGDGPETDLLVAENPEAVYLDRLALVNARAGVAVNDRRAAGAGGGAVAVVGGLMYDCAWVVDARNPEDPAAPVPVDLQVRDTVIYGRIRNAARSCELLNNWHCMDMTVHEQAVIEHRAGNMLARSILGVPICLKGNPVYRRYPKADQSTRHPWAYGANQRWFDNYAKLHVQDMRIGGEGMGMPGVYMMDPGAVLFLEGGYAHFVNEHSRQTAVFFEAPPKAALMYNVRGYPFTQVPTPGQEGRRQMLYKVREGVALAPGTVHATATPIRLPDEVGLEVVAAEKVATP